MSDEDATNHLARSYVERLQRQRITHCVANLQTTLDLWNWGECLLPLTINDTAGGSTYLCSPRVHYIDYVRDELARFPSPLAGLALRQVTRAGSLFLDLARSERVVHLNNWLFSTNLPRALDPGLVGAQTRALSARYPAHLIAIKSLSLSYSGTLMEALEEAGWRLLPSRQVFLIDDFARDFRPRRDTKRDAVLWRDMPFSYEEVSTLDAADAARIAELYGMLYLDKHTRLNPAYTEDFVAMCGGLGVLRYLLLRGADRRVMAFGAMHVVDGHATMPLIGYDTSADPALGLYRLAFYAGALFAEGRGLQFNMSSGAGDFKRNRGARGEIEYTAFYAKHLPANRQLPIAMLAALSRTVGEPTLRKYGI